MSPRKPKKHRPWRAAASFNPVSAEYKDYKPHQHTLIEVRRHDGPYVLIIDVCTGENCTYEKARDLIPGEGDDHASNK